MSRPKQFGKYELITELGRGGFATVFKARDTALDRFVALKILHLHHNEDPDFVARFRQEAKIIARLDHPNIVTIYETGEFKGRVYIAMKYLPGRTLSNLLKEEGPLAPEKALPILEQLAQALDYAHGWGIVHRDVKPTNIMVEKVGDSLRATLMDFGLVKSLAQSLSATPGNTILGSPEYMAPEQADLEQLEEVGPAADRYALGVVAYQMFTGRVPFPGHSLATLNAHQYEKVPAPQSFRPEISAQVSAALLKMLAKEADDRFDSALAFVANLKAGWQKNLAKSQAVVGWGHIQRPFGLAILVLGLLGLLLANWPFTYRPPEPTATAPAGISQAATATLPPSPSPSPTLSPTTASSPTPTPTITAIGSPTASPSPSATPIPPTMTPSATPTLNPALLPAAPQAGDSWLRPADNASMVYVPAGNFTMGQASGNSNEQPTHQVTLDGFWIDQLEVTNDQYRLCVADNACRPSSYDDNFIYNGKDYPVVGVDWQDGANYCAWVGSRLASITVILPSEAQWEYAARGNNNWLYPWGNNPPNANLLNYNFNVNRTTPAGNYENGRSWVGAYDMAGNVREWVADWYGNYPAEAQMNPAGPETGLFRVMRGGSWFDTPLAIRATGRWGIDPTFSSSVIGFRCVAYSP